MLSPKCAKKSLQDAKYNYGVKSKFYCNFTLKRGQIPSIMMHNSLPPPPPSSRDNFVFLDVFFLWTQNYWVSQKKRNMFDRL